MAYPMRTNGKRGSGLTGPALVALVLDVAVLACGANQENREEDHRTEDDDRCEDLERHGDREGEQCDHRPPASAPASSGSARRARGPPGRSGRGIVSPARVATTSQAVTSPKAIVKPLSLGRADADAPTAVPARMVAAIWP